MGVTDVTIGEWIALSADRDPQAACLIEAAGPVHTFGSVNEQVNRLVSSLRSAGVGRGDRLAVLAADSVGFVVTVLAAMKLGATYVPLNVRLSAVEIRTLLERAAPVVLFHDARHADIVGSIDGVVTSIRHVVAYDGHPVGAAGSTFTDLVAGGEPVEPPIVASDADILGLAFTSGTTGLPKGVLQSQRMIKAMTWSVLVDYRVRPDDVRYCAAPLFHISGLAMTLMGIAIGSTSVVAPQFDPSLTLGLLADDRLTACFMVPTMISSVLALPEVDAHRYERLELIMYGAAPMSPSLLQRAMSTFECEFLNAFGAGTEAGLQTVLGPEDHRRALAGETGLLGSIGKPAVGVALRLVDEALRDVASGEIGEIATRSDSVMDGYLDMPEATAEALRDGWFRAGDLAWRDDEGFLYLAGRRHDMIIRGGENIYPIEIETVLAAHPTVSACAVVGTPDLHWGEVVTAFVQLHEEGSTTATDLTEHCRSHLAAFKVPAEIRFVAALPLNASGKVLKGTLRDADTPPPPPDHARPAADDPRGVVR